MQSVDHDKISFGELLAEPGVEEPLQLRAKIGFLALHGGNLERVTDVIAGEAAERSGASFYAVVQPRGLRHHIRSTSMAPAESPKLAEFLDHCDVVISVHGYGIPGRWTDLLLGGRNRILASHVGSALRNTIPQYRIIDDIEAIPRRLRGQHKDNPCNLTAGGGIQIELPPRVRGLTPLATHWPGERPTSRFAHVDDLINGLATAADSWSL